jgi:hypothetical protein
MSQTHAPLKPDIYAIVAEFETPDQLLHAAERSREFGFRGIDAFSPFPIHGLSEATGFKCNLVPWMFLIGGIVGGLAGIALEAFVSVMDLPLDVGGKPLFSTASFFPIMFECTILFSALSGAIGMMALNGFPRPHHPVFDCPGFERATQDRFFLAIEANDPLYDEEETRRFLATLHPLNVSVVEDEQ